MDEMLIIGAFASLVTIVVAFLTPIIRLNTVITKLNSMLEQQVCDGERRNHRLDIHSDRLDAVEHSVTEHDVRIRHLEHYHRDD